MLPLPPLHPLHQLGGAATAPGSGEGGIHAHSPVRRGTPGPTLGPIPTAGLCLLRPKGREGALTLIGRDRLGAGGGWKWDPASFPPSPPPQCPSPSGCPRTGSWLRMELVKGEHVSSGEAEAGVTPAAPWHPVTVSVGQGIGGVGEEILLLTLSLFKQSPPPTMRAFWGAFSAPLLCFPIGTPPCGCSVWHSWG